MTDTHAYATEQLAGQPVPGRVEDSPIFPIVGLVGAAGSRQALETFFRHVPNDSGMAFVVVTRLAAKQHSQLTAAIEARTDMPVLSAADSATIQLDHIYIAPLGVQLTIAQGILRLHNHTRAAEQGLLDTFLSSLADDQQENAVAILLSGTGEDGIAGLQAVKTQGGIVLVQEPDNAAHPALPRRGVATGIADHVNAAAELAQYLIQIRGDLANAPLPTQQTNDESFTQLFTAILAQIATQTGHDLSHYKASTLHRRIARRMQMAGMHDLARYLELLQTNPAETRGLFRDSLVSVTSFFRDPDAYEMLERDCIPLLFLNKGRTDFVRIWVAGCATGEEAYSIAIQLAERALQMPEPPRFQIFATDLDEEAIAVARRGLYPATIAKDIAQARLQRYFVEENGAYRVKPEIREHVLFAVHNLLKDPPFSRVDLIGCRNVLIYFTREAQERIFNLFHYSLNAGGYLFLGTSESADTASDLFAVLNKYCHLYQRRDVINLPQHRLPTATPSAFGAKGSERTAQPQSTKARTVEEMYMAWTLRVHTPPRLLVNEHYDITYLFGGADRYLQEREGAITQNVLHKVLPDLRLDLRAALYQAFNKRERTLSRVMRVELDGRAQMVQLHVGPVTEPGFPHEYVEVVFLVQENAALLGLPSGDEAVEIDLSLVARMEEELLRTRERLQTIIEEYEVSGQELKTSNEELQSINEELKSTTEELETSKEELQSMNEELITVNHELKFKIDELSRANSDLLNLIASTDVGVIFLDDRLCVKRFTPRATELFHLIESDLGRPFAHIAHRIRLSTLAVRPLEYAARVLETLEQVEAIIQSEDDRWYMLRLFPYRTIDQIVDGVVITFIDISDLKRAESEVQQRIQQQAVAELGRQALSSDDLPELLASATARIAQTLELELCGVFALHSEAGKETLHLVTGVGWPKDLLGQTVIEANNDYPNWVALKQDEPVVVEDIAQEQRLRFSLPFSSQGTVSGVSVVIGDSEHPYGVLAAYSTQPHVFAVYEISFVQSVANLLGEALAHQQTEDALRTSETRLNAILYNIPASVYLLTTDHRYLLVNRVYEQENNITNAEIRGQSVYDRWPATVAETLAANERQVVATKAPIAIEETVLRDGETYSYATVKAPLLDAAGEPYAIIGISTDITDRKHAETALRRSEERYRTLFETMDEGFCVIEMIFDAANQPLDYRFLEINPAFEQFTGLEQAVDKTARALVPNLEPHWFEIYGNIALTGEPQRFIEGSAAMGRWFDVYAFRLGGPESRRVALLFNNITERKRVEDEVQRSRTLLQRMAEASPDDISIYDLRQEQIIFSNRKPGLTNFSGETIWATTPAEINSPIHPDDVEQVQKEFQRIHTAADGQVVETVFRQRQPDGDYCWHQERTVVFARDDQGQVIQYLSISTDIDDRKRAEHNQQFLSELSVALSLISDPTQIQQTVVQRLGEYLGVSRCRFSAIDLAADKSTLLASWRQSDEQPPLNMIPLSAFASPAYIADAQAGRTLVVHDARADSRPMTPQRLLFDRGLAAQMSVPCLRNGQWVASLHILQSTPRQWQADEVQLVESVVHQFWPLLERARAEEALRISELRFRSTFENAAVGIAEIGLDGRWVRVNERLTEIVGYTPAELQATTFQAITHPDDLETDLTNMRRVLAGEGERHHLEKRYFHKEGHLVWVLLSVALLRDQAGVPEYFIAVVEDINERKLQEQALQELNATSDQRVRDRTAELERSNRELDRFAYVASHDLKSPLRGIDTLAGWISEDADAVLPTASREHLSKLRGRIKRLENLLDDLLAYSRAGRYQYSPESVATGALVEGIIELLGPPSAFSVTVAETMPKLLTTRTPLETVLRNLINNAIKHHDRVDGHVHIVAEEHTDYVEFRVIDDGPGIDPQYHDRIFELFQTLKPRDQVEGSGMGLAIVKKTVENYGGWITVESAEGEGATFRFIWPKWKE